MNRLDLIETIKKLDEFYSDADLSGHTDIQLNFILAEIAQQSFRGRKLAPAFLETRKFSIQTVIFDVEREKYVVSGAKPEHGTYEFTADEIVDLYETKLTETRKESFAFCK